MGLPDVRDITREITERYASDPGAFSDQTGCIPQNDSEFTLTYFGTSHTVGTPDCYLDPPISDYERILVLHYLRGTAEGYHKTINSPETAKYVSFQSLPNGMFYYGPFRRRTVDRLLPIFGENLDLFRRSAVTLGAIPHVEGDAAANFRAFDKIEVRVLLNYGDDEFPPEMNILFPDYISDYFTLEDVAVLGGIVASRLIKTAKT